jgi:hypothetical protein
METTRFSNQIRTVLPAGFDAVDDRRQIVFQVVETFGYLVEALLERVEARPEGVVAVDGGLVDVWRAAAVQYGVEVLGVPAERDSSVRVLRRRSTVWC